MAKIIITKSAKETKKIAAKIAREIYSFETRPRKQLTRSGLGKGKQAIVIGLIGELGSGKTVFSQGFAEGLGIKENVTSPTFVLERIYELTGKKHRHLVHIDAYRIEKSGEMAALGFKNLIKNPQNIILIEWADRIKTILPQDCILIKFEHFDKNKRKITIWKNKKRF